MTEQHPSDARAKRWDIALYLLFVLATSFFTYMYRYTFPPHPFWDEPYHIAAAQKYMNGVFFMEQHPPLGKLLIALGEKIVRPDQKTDEFITTDYARNIPEEFSFAGYRLFPSLLGWLTAPLLFLCFLVITGSSPLSALLSFLYIFDNAEIVHSRGAMLDSTLTFFAVLMIFLFLLLAQRRKVPGIVRHSVLALLLGVAFGLVMTTKVVGLIMILLFPALLVRFFPDWRRITLLMVASAAGFIVTFAGVWQIHFALGSKIVPDLPDAGYYQASEEAKSILQDGRNGSLAAFPILLRDALKFIPHYNRGVPRLDLCKDDENGSPAFFWPFGARTINYRWEGSGDGSFRYLYLVTNPIGWSLALLGIIVSVTLVLGTLFFRTAEKLKDRYLFVVFLCLYFGYMIAISTIPRVMYLYHYFVPLIFSYFLFALAFTNLPRIGQFVLTEQRRIIALTILGLTVFAAFQIYRPFSYYEPINAKGVARRALLPLWELRCTDCPHVSPLVVPRSGT